MKKTWIRKLGTGLVLAAWLGLSLTAWFRTPDSFSQAERRKLSQFPQLSVQTVANGTFMSRFESYTQDQFPGRDVFRTFKALFHQNVFHQLDNHGIYRTDGYAAKLEYPLNAVSVRSAMKKFNTLYEQHLRNTGSKICFAVVPDKSYYLAAAKGYLAMDYEALFQLVAEGSPWAAQVDLTDTLSIEDYYRTDTHWRQEQLLPAAQQLCAALDVPAPKEGDYTQETVLNDFYGVYHGQAALPMAGEPLNILRSPLLEGCTVTNYETGKTSPVYDLEKLTGRDPYDVFLSGATPLLTMHNPAGKPGRELLLFRDSFGSSMAPLLVQGYETVTLIDIRYLSSDYLPQLVDFHGQDVLFLYSTTVLNNSGTLK